MLLLESAMIGVFVSLDLFLFYVFWDAMLIPMYFLIGIWGYDRRIYAAVKFILYTMAGSVLMLLAIIGLAYLHHAATGSLQLRPAEALRRCRLPPHHAVLVLPRVRAGVRDQGAAVPVPHLAARRARRGADRRLGDPGRRAAEDGHLRPACASRSRCSRRGRAFFAPYLARPRRSIGIIYGALVAMVQPDMKKLVAYSSVSHLGFVVLGICAMNMQGVQGAVYQMLNHGVSTGGLFLIVGMLSDRRHTRLIAEFGGLKKVMPHLVAAFLIVTLSSIGLPGLNGFVGEFLILLGAFRWNPRCAAFAATGVILSAVYMLWMFQRVNYGTVTNEKNAALPDLSAARMGGDRADRRDGDPDGRAAEPVPEADGAVGRADAEPDPSGGAGRIQAESAAGSDAACGAVRRRADRAGACRTRIARSRIAPRWPDDAVAARDRADGVRDAPPASPR